MMEGNIECHPFPFFDNLTTPPDLLCYDLEICVAVELPPSPFKLPLHPAEKEEYLANMKILNWYTSVPVPVAHQFGSDEAAVTPGSVAIVQPQRPTCKVSLPPTSS